MFYDRSICRNLESHCGGDDAQATHLVEAALAQGLPPLDILNQGVVAGINQTGELWAANKFFLPDVILSADAFKAAMVPLEPRLKASRGGEPSHKFVIGVVQGDMHDLGKSLVIAMLTSAGFEVIDLGIDVPKEKFIEAVRQYRAGHPGVGSLHEHDHAGDEGCHRGAGKTGLAAGDKGDGRRGAHQPGVC